MSDEIKSLGHNYDGIEELDNSLPRWWLATLWGTVVFAGGYFYFYVLGNGPTLVREYEHELVASEIAAAASGGSKQGPTEAELRALLADPARRTQGDAQFQAKCMSCHGAQGQGGIGPNLTDDYWIHGGSLVQIARTISVGVTDKGMPPWGPILKDDEIQSLVVFVRSLRGTNPAGAKAPQGELAKLKE